MEPLEYSAHTVLIVDDNPQNLQLLADFLRSWQLRVLIAKNGGDALKRAAQQQPDLLLLDVMMPEMDGFTVCRKLQKDPESAHIPVIFMTALADGDNKVRGFEVGGVDYITKPFNQAEVLARVTAQLRIHQLTRALQAANADLEAKVAARTAELAQALAEAQLRDTKKSEFIDILGHELRTPLTVIQGYVQIVAQGRAALTPAILTALNTATQQLAGIIDTVIDVARLDRGALVVKPAPHDVTVTLRRLAALYAETLAERQLTLTLDLQPLPLIAADPQALYRALEQLLLNAIQFTPDGGQITVSAAAYVDTGRQFLELVVSDTGIGIDPAERRLIFEKFYRTGLVAHHSTGKTKFQGGGPGLGLTLVQGLIAAHGGRVWVESPGCDATQCPGSAFYVVLPVGGERGAPPAPDRAEPARANGSSE